MNILQATLYGMNKVADNLRDKFDKVLVDGNKLPNWDYNSEAIVKVILKLKKYRRLQSWRKSIEIEFVWNMINFIQNMVLLSTRVTQQKSILKISENMVY